ncbi:hypothetical protein [Marinomonas gallaica]
MQAKEELAQRVEEQIHGLGMPYARFHIHCEPLIKSALMAMKKLNTYRF